MKSRKNHSVARILGACLLAAATFAGCKSLSPAEATRTAMDETRALIRASVTDPARAERMQARINALGADLEAFGETRAARKRALVQANADYNTSREEMQALYDAFNEDSRAMLDKLTAAHLELKALATEEEWVAISRPDHRIGGIKG